MGVFWGTRLSARYDSASADFVDTSICVFCEGERGGGEMGGGEMGGGEMGGGEMGGGEMVEGRWVEGIIHPQHTRHMHQPTNQLNEHKSHAPINQSG